MSFDLVTPKMTNDVRDAWDRGTRLFGSSDHVSLKEYIGKHFMYPELVIAAMADENVAIIGSRAFDFFFPGSCDENNKESSRWDFMSGHRVMASVPGCLSGSLFAWLMLCDLVLGTGEKGML